MEKHARAPDPLTDESPMDKTWRMWKQAFIIFLKVGGFEDKSSEEKSFLLMNKIGKVGLQAIEDIVFDNEDEKSDFNILLSKLDNHFDPPKREIEERYKFYTRSKRGNETIDNYIADLREKAKTCNYGDLTESMIRDMVILDIKDKHLRTILFETKDLDLDKLILLYKQYTINTAKMKEVSKKVTADNPDVKPKNTNCWRCDTSHAPRNCPAFKSVCTKCNEKGHFTNRCNKNKINNTNVNSNQNINKNKNAGKNPFSQSAKKVLQ